MVYSYSQASSGSHKAVGEEGVLGLEKRLCNFDDGGQHLVNFHWPYVVCLGNT